MRYRLIIVAATVIWGSSFVIVKSAVDFIDVSLLLFLRFATAAILLALVFMKHRALYLKREYILYGLLFGAAIGVAYLFQTYAIIYTTPGKNAFLTATYCIMVPFLAWFTTRKLPSPINVGAAVLAVGGIGLMSLGSVDGFTLGDGLTLVCALFFAIHIILVGKFSEGRNIFVLTIWQFVGVAVLSGIVAIVTGANPAQLATLDLTQWGSVAYLAVMCTAVALLFQNIGQSHLPPASAGLLLSLESPFGVLFSVLFAGEIVTAQTLLGFALIFVAVIMSEWLPSRLERR